MKKYLLNFVFIISVLFSFGQNNWIKKEVGNKVYVNFPNEPTYKLKDKAGTYTSKTDTCIFIAVVQYDALPNYSEFVKLSIENQQKLIEEFLDNAIKGVFIQSATEGVPFRAIKVGKYSGREASYSAINPLTGNRTMRFVKLFYALNAVYFFQCFPTQDGKTCVNDKNSFLNSITAN